MSVNEVTLWDLNAKYIVGRGMVAFNRTLGEGQLLKWKGRYYICSPAHLVRPDRKLNYYEIELVTATNAIEEVK